jgi:uncharacterized protein (DUF1499 family)
MAKRALAAGALLIAAAAAGIALHLALATGDTMFSGKRPSYLGLRDGRLASCRERLNCVSSDADPSDAQRYVAPIAFRGSAAEAIAAARRAIEGMERARVVREEANYLYAEFRSRLMGFVDDLELTYDASAGALQVRSASRLGRRDYGVNRARVEALRARLKA